MNNMTDHYATLGIPRDAGTDAIAKAWRQAASQHHPDKGGDVEKFRAARAAFECLMERESRAAHDAKLAGPQSSAPPITQRTYDEALKISGAFKGAAICPVCDGSKEVRIAQDGGFWSRKPCPACS